MATREAGDGGTAAEALSPPLLGASEGVKGDTVAELPPGGKAAEGGK